MVAAISHYFNIHRDQYHRGSSALQPYQQFMYLGAYRALVEYRRNNAKFGLTNDDFLHLLLVLCSKS